MPPETKEDKQVVEEEIVKSEVVHPIEPSVEMVPSSEVGAIGNSVEEVPQAIAPIPPMETSSTETVLVPTETAVAPANIDSGAGAGMTGGVVNDVPAVVIPPVVVLPPVIENKRNFLMELLAKAREKMQFRKRKKLERILAEVGKSGKITNDEVEKLLRVSDKTAERYLSQLVKEGKIKTNGMKGKALVYLTV